MNSSSPGNEALQTAKPTMPTATDHTLSSSSTTSTTPLPFIFPNFSSTSTTETPPDKLLDLFLQRLRGEIPTFPPAPAVELTPPTLPPVDHTTPPAGDSTMGEPENALDAFLQRLRERPSSKMPSPPTPLADFPPFKISDYGMESSGESPVSNPGEGSGDGTSQNLPAVPFSTRIPLLEELKSEMGTSKENQINSSGTHTEFVRSAEQLNAGSSSPLPNVNISFKKNDGENKHSDLNRVSDVTNHSVFHVEEEVHSPPIEERRETTTFEDDTTSTPTDRIETTTYRFEDVPTINNEQETTTEPTTIDTTLRDTTTTEDMTSTSEFNKEPSTVWLPYDEQVIPSDQNPASFAQDGSKFVIETSPEVVPPFFLFEEVVSDIFNKSGLYRNPESNFRRI